MFSVQRLTHDLGGGPGLTKGVFAQCSGADQLQQVAMGGTKIPPMGFPLLARQAVGKLGGLKLDVQRRDFDRGCGEGGHIGLQPGLPDRQDGIALAPVPLAGFEKIIPQPVTFAPIAPVGFDRSLEKFQTVAACLDKRRAGRTSVFQLSHDYGRFRLPKSWNSH